MSKISIIVHGGAWNIPNHLVEANKKACLTAVSLGWGILTAGGSALDAVERAIRVLEDAPSTGAGKGASLNKDGEIELDAAIMEGKKLAVGGVAAVKNIRNPISLARKVMEETPHVLLAGEGALKFARTIHFPECDPKELLTEGEFLAWKNKEKVENSFIKKSLDTVGCVALDEAGNVAVGNSTGGVRMKLPGRVGDSPLVGCGIYGDNDVGGVACTGWGENIAKVVLAKTTIELMRVYSPNLATQKAIKILKEKVDGIGGVIAIRKDGRVSYDFNTPRMAFGYRTKGMEEAFIGIEPEDKLPYEFKYRKGVGAVVISKEGKFLICQRREEPNHWQFPQGGIDDGEPPIVTLKRELKEEVGTSQFRPILRLPHKTRYLWNGEKRMSDRYDGQEHIWFLTTFWGEESDLQATEEFTAFRWVEFDQILNETHELRRETYSKVIEMLLEIKNILNF
jgi:L-asparaginase / beta-aspartyl-peptidase